MHGLARNAQWGNNGTNVMRNQPLPDWIKVLLYKMKSIPSIIISKESMVMQFKVPKVVPTTIVLLNGYTTKMITND